MLVKEIHGIQYHGIQYPIQHLIVRSHKISKQEVGSSNEDITFKF